MNNEARAALREIEHVDRFVSIPDVHIDNAQRERIHRLANEAKKTIRLLPSNGNFADIIRHETISHVHDEVINAAQHAIAPPITNVYSKPVEKPAVVYSARESDLIRQINSAEHEVHNLKSREAKFNLILEQRTGRLSTELQNLTYERIQRIAAKNRAVRKIKLLRAELAKVQSELAKVTADLVKITAEHNALRALVHGDAAQIGYVQELINIKNQLAAAAAENTRLTAVLSKSQTDEAAAQVQIAAHAATITALTAAESALQLDLAAEKAARAGDAQQAQVALDGVQKLLAAEIGKYLQEQQTVAQCRRGIAQYQKDIADEQAQVQQLTARLKVSAAALAQLAGEKFAVEQASQAAAALASGEIAALKAAQATDAAQLAKLGADLLQAETDQKQAEALHVAATTEIAQLKADQHNAQQQAAAQIATLEADIRVLQAAQQADQHTAQQAAQQIATHEATIQQLEAAQLADAAKISKLNDDIQQQAAQQAADIAAHKATIQQLEAAQLADAAQQAADIAAHKATIQQLEAAQLVDAAKIGELNDDIQQQAAQQPAQQQAAQQLNDDIQNLQTKQAADAAQIAKLTSDIQQLRAAQQPANQPAAPQIAALEANIKQLQAAQQAQQSTDAAEIGRLTGEIQIQQTQQAASAALVAQLRAQIATTQQKISELEDKIKLDSQASQAAAQQADAQLKAVTAAQQSAEQARRAADAEVTRLQMSNQLLTAQLTAAPKAKKRSGKLAAQLASQQTALTAAQAAAQAATQQAEQAVRDLQAAQQAAAHAATQAADALQKQKQETDAANLQITQMIQQNLLSQQEIADLKARDLSALLATINVNTADELKTYITTNQERVQNLNIRIDTLDELIEKKEQLIKKLTSESSEYQIEAEDAKINQRHAENIYSALRTKVIEIFKLPDDAHVFRELSKYTDTLSEFEKTNINKNISDIQKLYEKMHTAIVGNAGGIQTGPLFSRIFTQINGQIKQLVTPEVEEFIDNHRNLQFASNDPFTENNIDSTNKQESMLLLTAYYIMRLQQVKSEIVTKHGDLIEQFQQLDEYANADNTSDTFDTIQRFAAFQKNFHTIETTTQAAFGEIISDIKDWVKQYKITGQPVPVDDSDDEQPSQPSTQADQPAKPATISKLLTMFRAAPSQAPADTSNNELDQQLDDDFAAPAPLNQSINDVYEVLKEICGKLNIPVAQLPTNLNVQLCVTNIKKAIEQQTKRHEAEHKQFISDLQLAREETERLKTDWAEITVLRQQIERQAQEIAKHTRRMDRINRENSDIQRDFDVRLSRDVNAAGIFTRLTEENAKFAIDIKMQKESYERKLSDIEQSLKIRTQMTTMSLDDADKAAVDAKIAESLSDLQKQVDDPDLRDALAAKIAADTAAVVAKIAEQKNLERVKVLAEEYSKIYDHAVLHQRYIDHEALSQAQITKFRHAANLDIATIQELREQIRIQTGENETLTAEMVSALEENGQLIQQLETAAQSITATEAEREQFRVARDELEAKLTACLADNKIKDLNINRITQELSDAKAEAARLKLEAEAATQESAAASARIAQLTKRKPIMAPVVAKVAQAVASNDKATAFTNQKTQIENIIKEFDILAKVLAVSLNADTKAKKKFDLIRAALQTAKQASQANQDSADQAQQAPPVTGGAQPNRIKYNFEYIFIITVLVVLTVYLLYLIQHGRSKRLYQSRGPQGKASHQASQQQSQTKPKKAGCAGHDRSA